MFVFIIIITTKVPSLCNPITKAARKAARYLT